MLLENKVCLVTDGDVAEGAKWLVAHIVRKGGEEAVTQIRAHGADASFQRHASVQ